MSVSQTEKSQQKATRTQLRSLGRLMGREVKLHQISERTGHSIGWLSEVTRGILPGTRAVTKGEYERLRQVILVFRRGARR